MNRTAATDESTPGQVAAAARQLYVDGPALLRRMQHYRPYIAPFHLLLDRMPQDASVLDIGCGGGLFLGLLALKGRLRAGLGVDADARAIALAQTMAHRLPAKTPLRFQQLPPGEPLPAGPFDVVAMLDVLHHVDPAQQRALLEQSIARTRPGGLFLYKDMAHKPRWKAAANRLHDALIARQWIHPVALPEVLRWALAQGCSVREQGAIDMLWYAHEFVVFQRGHAAAGPIVPDTPGRPD